MKTSLLQHVGQHFSVCCSQPRYQTAWLIGLPLCGKSSFARELCLSFSWKYCNYTLDKGLLDTLHNIETYQPEDFLRDLSQECTKHQSITLVDEIDAVLATWSFEQRKLFANRASRLGNMTYGLVLVSNFFTATTLAPLLPDNDQPLYFDLSGVQQ